MPIAYKVDVALGIVLADWRGTVTAKDITEHWTRFVADKAAMACGGAITDISCCDILFTPEELKAVTKKILEPALRGKNWKTAVIVKNPVQFGVTKQQEIFSETFVKMNVFYSDVMARKWVLG